MNTENIRLDLNEWHIAARAGSIKKIKELVAQDYGRDLLYQENKSGWIPINLAKNKETAVFIYALMNEDLSLELINKSLWNNAESTQTRYGEDFKFFLKEKNFTELDKLAKEPSYQERVSLSKFWLELSKGNVEGTNINYDGFNSSILLALSCSNAFFIQAIFELKNEKLIEKLKNVCISNVVIGGEFYRKDYAYKIFQYIYQNLNIKLMIAINKMDDYESELNRKIDFSANPLLNLEGF